jgi:Flp pilus assembly pilin Flp
VDFATVRHLPLKKSAPVSLSIGHTGDRARCGNSLCGESGCRDRYPDQMRCIRRALASRPRRHLGRYPESSESGAAAVEFALVLPILVLILFGIIDYGLYFNASLQSRWGVHDAARATAVSPSTAGTTCTATAAPVPPADIQRLICAVLANTGSATAKKYVAVSLPDGWVVGKQLVVCERLDVAGVTGYVPLPGSIKDIAVLTIETEGDADPTWVKTDHPQKYEQALPNGSNWNWCAP